MLIKDITHEDFSNYKTPSMFIGTAVCDWKCCKEQCLDITVCQNSKLASLPSFDVPIPKIFDWYINNSITSAIVIGGLEPFKQFNDVFNLVKYFRGWCIKDDIVIYTGYYPDELQPQIEELKKYQNIIIKFGRYIPNNEPHFDKVLGVKLISDNQYAVKIS